MHAQRIAALFKSLPGTIKETLLAGAVHPGHLLRLTQQVLDAAAVPRGAELLRAINPLTTSLVAWAENPMSGVLAANVLTMDQSFPGLNQQAKQVLTHLVAGWNQPDSMPATMIDPSAPLPDQLAWAETMARENPNALYWQERVVSLARQMGAIGPVRQCMDRGTWPEELSVVRDLVLAEAALVEGRPGEAAEIYGRLRGVFPQAFDSRLAEARFRSGDEAGARSVWLAASLAQPWNVNNVLLLHDAAAGVRQAAETLDGNVAILLYSFNNAEEVDNTLASVAASELDGARIIALDNGSGDTTGEVMLSWRERLGKDRMDVVELPVNIGAPAARNWLMQLDAVRGADYAVYLDDDVALEPDWLRKLGAAAARYPDAGVWGCKVVDHAEPLRVQCAETALLPSSDPKNPLSLWALHEGSPDTGRFEYMRPTASVTGCCHLFRTERLLEVGPFDIRFSPTQFDDLDRDLRMLAMGGHAVYTGHLSVRHKRLSGGMSERSAMELGNVNGNLQKLYSKYDLPTVEAMREQVSTAQERDLLRKAVWLDHNLDT